MTNIIVCGGELRVAAMYVEGCMEMSKKLSPLQMKVKTILKVCVRVRARRMRRLLHAIWL